MIARDGRKVSAVLLTPEMIAKLAQRWETHPDPVGHLFAVVVDGNVFFVPFEDTLPGRLPLIRKIPELGVPANAGYTIEPEELSRT